MKRKSAVLILAMSACFAAAFFFAAVEAEASEKDKVWRACEQLFGKPVDENPSLFEVNRFYVLRVKFDNRDNLQELAVEPKYYFAEAHSDWKETDNFTYLSIEEYKNLLARLDAIKPKGALVKPTDNISIVTNSTAHHTEIYENASLKWGSLVDLRRDENAPSEIRWFRLNYEKQKSR